MIELIVSKAEDGRKVKNFLMKHFPLAPSSLLYRTLREKDVKVNGIRIKGEEILQAGDQVIVYFSDEKARSLGYQSEKTEKTPDSEKSQKSVFNSSVSAGTEHRASTKSTGKDQKEKKNFPRIPVVYEDDRVLVLNKPVGVLSQKDSPQSYSLTEYLKDQYSDESGFAPAIVNRLDRNTSGIVLAGRTVRSLQQLNAMIRYHRGEKLYLAVVQGVWKKDDAQYVVHRWGKKASTNTAKVKRVYAGTELPEEYHDLKEQEEPKEERRQKKQDESLVLCHVKGLAVNADASLSLVLLKLYTGKSHQLRSQLEELGYPIVGDPKYQKKQSSDLKIRHQMLHAWRYRMEQLSDGLEYLNGRAFTASPDREFTQLTKLLFPDWEKNI